MRPHSKRYTKAAELVDPDKKYAVDEAAQLLGKLGKTKFDQTINLAVHLGIDPKKQDQAIRGAYSLPKGIGKSRKVIVFAEGDLAKQAKEAGADEVGAEDLVKKIMDGWTDFDVAIAVPAMMRHVGKLGKVLGPQGKMPSPKAGTVTDNLLQAVKEFKAGKIEYRADAFGNVHAPVGKASFSPEDLKANIDAFLDHLKAIRPASAKGVYIKNVSVAPCMGPGISLAVS